LIKITCAKTETHANIPVRGIKSKSRKTNTYVSWLMKRSMIILSSISPTSRFYTLIILLLELKLLFSTCLNHVAEQARGR